VKLRSEIDAMNRFGLCALSGSVVVFCGFLIPERASTLEGLTKENLDLPYNVPGGEEEEEEDAPEIIVFCGLPVEADVFIFLVSATTGMYEPGSLERAKEEVQRNVREFREDVEFGIVAYHRTKGVQLYPRNGVPTRAGPAGSESRRNVLGFFGQFTDDNMYICIYDAFDAAFKMAAAGTSKRKRIIYLADGNDHRSCGKFEENESTILQRMTATVTARNIDKIPIDCIQAGIDSNSSILSLFLMDLASKNRGNYGRLWGE